MGAEVGGIRTVTTSTQAKVGSRLERHPLVRLFILASERVGEDKTALRVAKTGPRMGVQFATVISSRNVDFGKIAVTRHLHIGYGVGLYANEMSARNGSRGEHSGPIPLIQTICNHNLFNLANRILAGICTGRTP